MTCEELVLIVFGFQRIKTLSKKSGSYDAVGTPVPIPNTEVKHRGDDDTWGTGENNSLPGFFVYGVFSLIYAPTFDKNRGY